MKPKRVLALLAASIILPIVSLPAAAAIVTPFSDGFEDPPDPDGLGITLTNWIVESGSVDIVAPPGFGITTCGGGAQCLDLAGTTPGGIGSDGTIATNDNFGPGTYLVTFDLSGSQRGDAPNSVTVSLGGVAYPGGPITLASGAAWATYMFTATVAGAATDVLRFVSDSGNDNIGLLLDNVSVTVVPIPAALWLLGSGLLGMIGLSRRRKATANAEPAGI